MWGRCNMTDTRDLEAKLQLHYVQKIEKEIPKTYQKDFLNQFSQEQQKLYRLSASSIYEDAYQNTLVTMGIPKQYEFDFYQPKFGPYHIENEVVDDDL